MSSPGERASDSTDGAQRQTPRSEPQASDSPASNSDPQSSGSASSKTDRPGSSAPAREAREAVDDVYDSLGGDTSGLCALMTPRAQRQTVRYAEVSSGIAKDWNCELAVQQLVARSKRSGGFKSVGRAEVVGINIEGDRATATIRIGDGPAASLPLARHHGEWKLDSSPAGEAQ